MFTPIENCSEVLNIRGVDIYLPPFGYGFDTDDESVLKPVEIIKRSENELEQYWERQQPPDDFEEWL